MQSIDNNIGKQIDKSVTFDNHIFIDIDYICKSIEINGHNFFSCERYQVTGSPSSKYEHRRASALLRNIRNIRICMGKTPIVSVTYENERISIKKKTGYLTSNVCYVSTVWSMGRFMAVLWVVL